MDRQDAIGPVPPRPRNLPDEAGQASVTVTMDRLCQIVPARPRDIENWLRRYPLSTTYKNPGRGSARTFTEDNVLELALIAFLVKEGFTPSKAAERSGALINSQSRVKNWLDQPFISFNPAVIRVRVRRALQDARQQA